MIKLWKLKKFWDKLSSDTSSTQNLILSHSGMNPRLCQENAVATYGTNMNCYTDNRIKLNYGSEQMWT